MRLRNLIGGVAISLFVLCAAPAAFAQSDPCAGPFPGPNVSINKSGSCTITSAISVTGTVSITASGAISTQAISAGGTLGIQSTGGGINTNSAALTSGTSGPGSDLTLAATGNIATGAINASGSFGASTTGGTIEIPAAINSNQGGNGGNILLSATGNIGVGAISTNGGSATGGVEIDANTGGASSLFTIGSSTSNGAVSINTSNTSGGGTDPTFIVGGLNINNGTAASTGGITVTSMSAISVASSSGRSGIIQLNAQTGTLTLPTGELNADGVSGGAGFILLQAQTITTVGGTIISASEPVSPATSHDVYLAAKTVNVAGSGLQIHADGDGTGSYVATAGLFPQGAFTYTSNGDLDDLLWTVSGTNYTTNAPVTVAGAAPITITSNGANNIVSGTAYPLTFSNAAVTLQSKGGGNHSIALEYTGSYTGTNGLVFNGTGAVLIDASGMNSGDAGGQIHVYVDKATITASPSFTMHADGVGTGAGGFLVFQPTALTSLSSATTSITANGAGGTVEFQPNGGGGAASITSTTFGITANAPTSGGNAGSIYFQTGSLTLGASTKGSMTANGPTSGSGNGGYIDLSPGTITNLKLGTNAGDIKLTANGGSTTGNGGTIFSNPTGSITIDTAAAVSATLPASSTEGTGGTVSLYGNPNFTVTSGITGATINVDGKGTGTGGTINIQGSGTLALGTAAGGLSLSAQNNGGTGNGGAINVGYGTTLTVSAPLLVSAGMKSGSDGNGGTVNLHDATNITVTSTVDASADGSGSGGTITISGNGTLDLTSSTISANGGCNGGTGGTINETANALTVDNIDAYSAETCSFVARAAISPRVTGNANGGVSTIKTSAGLSKVQSGGINQNGSGTGQGGTITFNTGTALDMSLFGTGSVSALGGNSGGLGGKVTVVSLGTYPTNSLIDDIIKVNSADVTLAESKNDGQTIINGVTCQQRNLPSFANSKNVTYRYCDGTTLLGTTLTGLSTATKNVYQTAGVRLYVFASQSAATSYLGSAQVASDPSAQGFSLYSPSNYSVVYDTSNSYFAGTIRHEIGHQIDQNASTVVLSESAYMNDLMNEDWTYFNSISRCTLFPTICNTPPYNTESNKVILQSQAATASYFNPTAANPVGIQWREIFAEEFAIGAGGGAVGPSIDNFLAYFSCTQTYVTSVYQNGHSAAPNYSGHCTVPTDPRP